MNKSRVALVRCVDYDEENVCNAVQKGIDLLGGASAFARPGENIVLKPNVLLGNDPRKCVTTHPVVFKAVGKALLKTGAKLSFGDSSGIGKCEFNTTRSGLKQPAEELGISLADFDDGKAVSLSTALLVKQFTIANGILEADGVVSLPKLKTHGLTRMTGAIKNQFGCIPGIIKTQYHLKMPDPYDFATMLVDLNTFIRPRLFIMDGIIAMEGNGPMNGKLHPLNVLLFSGDPVSLDAIACKIIDLNPEFVPTSRPGEQAGLGTYHYEHIEIVGDPVESFIARDFDVVRKPPVAEVHGRAKSFLKNRVLPRPVIDRKTCISCGTCIRVCPVDPKAVNWKTTGKKKMPKYDYNRCIRCFCCQEMCPEGAITIRNSLLGRIVYH